MTRQSLDLLSPDPALEASLAAGLAQVEQELRESVRSSSPFISEAAGYLVEAGGKRFRPLLVLLAAKPLIFVVPALVSVTAPTRIA